MEGSLERYLGVFVPFAATVVLAHLIVRSGSSPLLARLASRALLLRVLSGSAVAMAIIVGVDLVTGGDLFLRPRFPASPLLAAVVLAMLVAAHYAARAAAPVARLFSRRDV